MLKNWSLTQSIFARSSKLRMYGAEGMNAIGTELLDQFGRVQTPNRKGIVGKNWHKSGGTSFRPEAPNEPVEWRKPQLVLR